MQVYDVKVSIQRTIQVKQYEPLVALVGLSANVAEGEDHNAIVAKLVADVKAGLKQFGASGGAEIKQVSSDTVVSPPAELPKATETSAKASAKTKPAKAEKPAAAKAKPAEKAAKPVVDEDEFKPTNTVSEDDFGTSTASEKAAEEIKEDWEPVAEEPAAPAITAQELATFLSKSVAADKSIVPQIKALLEKYEVAMSTHLNDEQRPKFKAELDKLIAAKK